MSIYRTRNGDLNLSSIKNSINEILPNKTPDSIERNKFEQSQHASLVKAVNNVESPVKEKHIRNIILGTCYEKSALPFWYSAIKLQLHGNPILCWKFCYVLHKLLRDGHPSTVTDSFRFVVNLDDLAKSWIHLKQGYGTMLYHYCNFLAFKIKFHKKNEFIPANLMIEDKDLNELASNDINNYFQLCCEFFDYADEIINLQNSVFHTMDRSRSNSMTESGQCKLAPLVLCIQESNQLYDFCVKFLFKLHENLPVETLEGHRERFLNIFKQLTKFYESCKNLQYFKNLITIPDLPINPPNFHHQSDFSSYSKPIAAVFEQPHTEQPIHVPSMASAVVDDPILVDFSDTQQQQQQLNNSSSSSSNNDSNSTQFQQQQIQQQQLYIYTQQLQQEIERIRKESERQNLESEFEIRNLRESLKTIQDELSTNRNELAQEKIKVTSLEEKLKIISDNENAKADLENLEKKAVSSEEKFNKMKELYTKLKDKHVELLRQDADVRKQNMSLNQTCEHINKTKEELEKRLQEANGERSKLEASLNEKTNELSNFKSEIEKTNVELKFANQDFEEKLQNLNEQKANLEADLAQSNIRIKEIEKSEKDLQEKCKNLILNSTSLESDFNRSKTEINNLQNKLIECSNQLEQAEKEFYSSQIELLERVYLSCLDQSLFVLNDSLKLFEDHILLNCKSGAEYLLVRIQPHDEYLNELSIHLKKFIEFNKQNQQTTNSKLNEEESKKFLNLIKSVNSFVKLVAETVVIGKITSLTAADLEQGEVLADLCRSLGQTSIDLIEKMKTKNTDCDEELKDLSEKMEKIIKILNELLPKVHDISKQELGDLIDQEMHNTTEAIEEAVAKLELLMNKSREQETGVKLEVNDKILDSCTALMKAIKMLIIRSKELQREIVAQGRGTSSVKEFYSKNHKWTEGLVTAAKLVGVGANILIEKADKLVNGDGKLEEIIACSNEIAASTAQLVAASNVKADRGSQNRIALIEAKNSVSNATAGLVASAKSCSQIIDEQTAMDFTKMSLHQTKRLEMEAQVKVLELEKQLETEKNKLYKLRKQHYHLVGEE